jgi:hypothetical protein
MKTFLALGCDKFVWVKKWEKIKRFLLQLEFGQTKVYKKCIFSYWCYVWNENSSFAEYVDSIDKLEVDARGFISNRKKGKESKIAERQRQSMCERQRVAARER